MNKVMIPAGLAILMFALPAAQSGAEEALAVRTPIDRENYNTGVTLVRNLKQQGGVINLDLVIQGMKDELKGSTLAFPTSEDASPSVAAERNTTTEAGEQASTAVYAKKAETLVAQEASTSAGPVNVLVMRQATQDAQDSPKANAAPQAGQPAPNTPYMYRDYAAYQHIRDMRAIKRANAASGGALQ